jgi:hypothetical protein
MSFIREHFINGHVRHGLKVGLASVLAYYLSGFVGLPYAYWAVITTVIVMQMHVADSINMCLYRFTGTAIGAVIGILLILIFPPTPVATMLGLFVGAGVCAYLTRYNERFRMAAITVAIVFLTSLGAENRIEFTLFRVVEIGIGVLCAFVVSVVVLPSRAGAVLRGKLREQYEELATHYTILMDNFLKRQKKTDPDLFFDLAGEAQKNREMFHKVFVTESRFFRDDVRLLSLQVTVLQSVLERLQSMPIILNDVEGDGFDIIMAPALTRLAKATSEAMRAIGQGVPHDTHELAAAVDVIENRFIELRSQGVTGRFSARRLFQVLSFINTSQHLGEYVLGVLNRPEMAQLK